MLLCEGLKPRRFTLSLLDFNQALVQSKRSTHLDQIPGFPATLVIFQPLQT